MKVLGSLRLIYYNLVRMARDCVPVDANRWQSGWVIICRRAGREMESLPCHLPIHCCTCPAGHLAPISSLRPTQWAEASGLLAPPSGANELKRCRTVISLVVALELARLISPLTHAPVHEH